MGRARQRRRIGLVAATALTIVTLSACENSTRLAEQGDEAETSPVATSTQPTSTTSTPTQQPPTAQPPTQETPQTPRPTRPSTPTQAPPSASGSASSPLSLGTFHLVGKDFRVSITAVNLNANRVIESANSFNDPPKGRYVLAEMSVVYLGSDEGDPWIDLGEKFVAADARQYDSNQCGAVVPHPGIFVPTLEHGGRAHYQVCWDIPVRALTRGKIFVEQTFVFEGPRLYWKSR
jgi:hypothetical protein